MSKLIPGEALVYEHVNGVVYARYRDITDIPRWIIGGDPDAVAKAQGQLLHWGEWENLQKLAKENITLKKQLDQVITTYYMIKEKGIK